MPRIKADNIAEHVAHQRAAVLEAAIRLFTTVGYHEVSLRDIAADVGLARNSIYRYVPDKAHLLVEWYRQTIPRTIDTWRTATEGTDDPALRLQRWARAYLEWANSPEHRLVAPLTESLPSLDDTTRAEIAALHTEMMQIVADTVRATGTAEHHVAGTVDLLTGLVLGAARAEAARGPDPDLQRRLDHAINALTATAR